MKGNVVFGRNPQKRSENEEILTTDMHAASVKTVQVTTMWNALGTRIEPWKQLI